jgi:gas vesicle protein
MAEDFEDEQEPSVEQDSEGGSGIAGFAVGVMLGALLGAGLALLYAPDRGERTRRQLKRRIKQLRADAEEGLDRAGERAARVRKELSRRRRKLEEGLDRAAEQARDVFDE